MTSAAILIPARYESKRFPGKPLALLKGIPMIERVYNACKLSGIDTYVLTDDIRIGNLFSDENVIVDTSKYTNGTERCAGAISKALKLDDYDTFINVQGDMPDIRVDMIEDCLDWVGIDPVHTLYTDMPEDSCDDPNTVKLVISNLDDALWFGRGITGYGEKHLGIYGYTREALEMYPTLKVTKEEETEQLEQLRWLKSGWSIGCSYVKFDGMEINHPTDAAKYNIRNKT
jgi:3-deoxy-manno-octulosonate cytidylyltransferase (CMP-KDO synthetase)